MRITYKFTLLMTAVLLAIVAYILYEVTTDIAQAQAQAQTQATQPNLPASAAAAAALPLPVKPGKVVKPQPALEPSQSRYFEETETETETGFNISGGFLSFWEAGVGGGRETFGLPLSNESQEHDLVSQKIRYVQWFEKAKFEYRAGAGQFGVAVAPLGKEALVMIAKTQLPQTAARAWWLNNSLSTDDLAFGTEPGEAQRLARITTALDGKFEALARAVEPVPAPPGSGIGTGTGTGSNSNPVKVQGDANAGEFSYFPTTRHTLRGSFARYWQTYGGQAVFGAPISEEYLELNPVTGRFQRVQWFENVRFEHRAEFAGTRYEVVTTPLGWQVFYLLPPVPVQTAPLGSNAEASPPTPPATNNPPGGSVTPAPGSVSKPVTTTAITTSNLGYGMNVWLFGQDHDRVFGLVKEAGFDWVRQQVGWDQIEARPGEYYWEELDRIVASAKKHKVRLILSVVRSPGWVGTNGGFPADVMSGAPGFTNLMREMATRYAGSRFTPLVTEQSGSGSHGSAARSGDESVAVVAAYQIWNEPNLGYETGGEVSAGKYVELLKAVYPVVRKAAPDTAVLFAGLSATGVNDPRYAVDDVEYLKQAYAYNNGEVRRYFDVLGAHTGSATNSPDEFWLSPEGPNPDAPAPERMERGWTTHPSFYFRRVEQLRAVMEQNGDGGKQIWLTEFGWTTKNPAAGYEYGAFVTEELQAKYLVRAFERAKAQYPWMGVMTVWQLNFATVVSDTDEKAAWGYCVQIGRRARPTSPSRTCLSSNQSSRLNYTSLYGNMVLVPSPIAEDAL
jgi:polysaccharide biosynthesis protein PslG